MVILVCYNTILFHSEPLQSTAEAHHIGYKAGQQLGDFLTSRWNLQLSKTMNYLAGQNLRAVQATIKDDYVKMMKDEKSDFLFGYILLHTQVIALQQGLHTLHAGRVEKLIPSEAELLAKDNSNLIVQIMSKINKLERSILFQQFSSNLLDDTNISGTIAEMKMQLRPMLCIGIFLEGLACYMLSHLVEKEAVPSTLAEPQSVKDCNNQLPQKDVLSEIGIKASKKLPTADLIENDPLLIFLQSQHQCIKGSVDEFYTWLVKSEDIDSMIALQEAVNEDEYLNTKIKNGNGSSGLKGFKVPPFKRAVLAYDNTKVIEDDKEKLTREPPDELVCPIMCPVIKATIAIGAVSETKTKLIERGQSVLTRIRSLAEHSSWNWENKVLLLEAMEMHTMGNLNAAEPLYISSIRSAREHKFIHEEAVASELAGEYSYEQGNHSDAYVLFMHSIKCFKEWGADAVAKRVEMSVQTKFGAKVSHLQAIDVSDAMKRIISLDQQQKKRSLVGLE